MADPLSPPEPDGQQPCGCPACLAPRADPDDHPAETSEHRTTATPSALRWLSNTLIAVGAQLASGGDLRSVALGIAVGLIGWGLRRVGPRP
ncbi:hypothetical protein [Kitasatospora cinereorecta]|uniref:Uncharacterized protein n=1 Tax=Kitasatospora cinereorecta TaxID=285560 RepID=A0ABW0VJ33_9ACTN